MAQNFIDLQERRALVYNRWNSALRKFTDPIEHTVTPEEYQEIVLDATRQLKELRESWLTVACSAYEGAFAAQISELEDRHLAATIKYHSCKIRQLPASYIEAAEIEEEISELLSELRQIERPNC